MAGVVALKAVGTGLYRGSQFSGVASVNENSTEKSAADYVPEQTVPGSHCSTGTRKHALVYLLTSNTHSLVNCNQQGSHSDVKQETRKGKRDTPKNCVLLYVVIDQTDQSEE